MRLSEAAAFWPGRGKTIQTQKNTMFNRHRKLRMEQMEAREMFSITPLSVNTTFDQVIDGGGGSIGNIPVSQGLNLSSRPGAPATLFLDFNGHHQIESWLGRRDFTT